MARSPHREFRITLGTQTFADVVGRRSSHGNARHSGDLGPARLLQSYVAKLVAAGVRLVPLGQTHEQLAIADLEPAVLAVAGTSGRSNDSRSGQDELINLGVNVIRDLKVLWS